MSSNEEEEYEVDRIINDRVEKGEKQYLIRWKNFGAWVNQNQVWFFDLNYFRDDDTWEPVSNLDCPEIIEAYERAKKAKTNEEKEKQDRIKRESYSRANPTKEPAKKKSKKVRQHSKKPIFIIFRMIMLDQLDGNEVSTLKK